MEQELRNWEEEDRLEKANKGKNFFGEKISEEKVVGKKMFYIKILLKITQNIKERNEVLEVDENLCNDYYSWDKSIEHFFEELQKFVKKPLAKIPAIVGLDRYELKNIGENFRERNIKFSDIKISIGELAKEKLDFDFAEKVKDILNLQTTTSSLQKEVDKFIQLKGKIEILKTRIGKETSYWNNSPTDDTLKLFLSNEEYNEKLKAIELEIRGLSKKLHIDIGDFRYKKVQKKLSYKKWLEINKCELEDNWENIKEEVEYRCEDEEENVPKTFEEYAKGIFEQTDGCIEVEWEGIPKH